MNIVSKINQFRRSVFSVATQKLSKHHQHTRVNVSQINKILICRPNSRLGNLLLITPLIHEIKSTIPNAKIDLVVKGHLAKKLFKSFDCINNICCLPTRPFKQPLNYLKKIHNITNEQYDLVINAVDSSSSGRILTKLSNAKGKLYGACELNNYLNRHNVKHVAKRPVFALREYLNNHQTEDVPYLDIILNEKELHDGEIILNNINRSNKKGTIAIFTFATGNKKHSKQWWHELYHELNRQFSEYNIVEILPLENVSQIDFEAPTYYGNNIREVAAVLNACDAFIGADSGIMHLASSVNVSTYGLFNCTDIDMYRPYNLNNHAIDTCQKSIGHIIEMLKTNFSGTIEKHK